MRKWLHIGEWLVFLAGWLVAGFTVIEEFCMVQACRDTAAFTFFGVSVGLLGIIYFTLLLAAQWAASRSLLFDRVRTALVFSGVGAELRLLWLQKFVIGSWCPLCVTICCALISGSLLLLIDKTLEAKSAASGKAFPVDTAAIAAAMTLIGVIVAYIGIRELT